MTTVETIIRSLASRYVAARAASRAAVAESSAATAHLLVSPIPSDEVFAAARAAAGACTIAEESALYESSRRLGEMLGREVRRAGVAAGARYPRGATDREIADAFVGR